jgi:hypothetical protein
MRLESRKGYGARGLLLARADRAGAAALIIPAAPRPHRGPRDRADSANSPGKSGTSSKY